MTHTDAELDLKSLMQQHAACDSYIKIHASDAGALAQISEISVSQHQHSIPCTGPTARPRDVCGWTARNLQRVPCISHNWRGKIAQLVVAWRLEAQQADPRCICPHCDRGTASPARQCTDESGASGFTTVSGEVRSDAAGAAIGNPKSSSVFSHRPPASPRTVLRQPDSFTLGNPKSNS